MSEVGISKKTIKEIGKQATIVTPTDICGIAQKNPDTLYVVFGSLYMIGEFLEK